MINLKKLLTEEIKKEPIMEQSDHVRNGLEKVFAAGNKEISYRMAENVGLGYIKSITEAIKCAIQESRKLAKKYGYKDNELNEKFIKEDNDFNQLSAENPEHSMAKVGSNELPHDNHDETDMSNPEEKREVQIAREILHLISQSDGGSSANEFYSILSKIVPLAQELLQIHGAK